MYSVGEKVASLLSAGNDTCDYGDTKSVNRCKRHPIVISLIDRQTDIARGVVLYTHPPLTIHAAQFSSTHARGEATLSYTKFGDKAEIWSDLKIFYSQ